MTFIIPIEYSGEIPSTETEVIYSSPGAVFINGANPVTESFALIELSGEGFAPAIGGHNLKAENLALSNASIEQGIFPAEPSLASFTLGEVVFEPSLSSIETSGEGLVPAFASLVSQNNPSLLGSLIYYSFAAFLIRSEVESESLASIRARESRLSRVFGAFAVRSESHEFSPAVFETGAEGAYPANASLDTGGGIESHSQAAIDAADGSGITVIIDMIDEILYGGHGDDC